MVKPPVIAEIEGAAEEGYQTLPAPGRGRWYPTPGRTD